MMKVEIIETSGQRTSYEIERPGLLDFIREKIDAKSLDFVLLKLSPNRRRRSLMAVDDSGWNYLLEVRGPGDYAHVPTTPKKPLNPIATSLYHSVCRPGTTHQIAGDVAIFEEVESFEL